jgi:hypothetical protein
MDEIPFIFSTDNFQKPTKAVPTGGRLIGYQPLSAGQCKVLCQSTFNGYILI